MPEHCNTHENILTVNDCDPAQRVLRSDKERFDFILNQGVYSAPLQQIIVIHLDKGPMMCFQFVQLSLKLSFLNNLR